MLSEYGTNGGSTLPSRLTLAQTVTMQPAGMLSKAYYLYEGGVNQVWNWLIHHSSIEYKSELLDVQNAYVSPYGNSLLLCSKMTDLKNRVKADSKGVNSVGLGIQVLATKDDTKAWLYWYGIITGLQQLQIKQFRFSSRIYHNRFLPVKKFIAPCML